MLSVPHGIFSCSTWSGHWKDSPHCHWQSCIYRSSSNTRLGVVFIFSIPLWLLLRLSFAVAEADWFLLRVTGEGGTQLIGSCASLPPAGLPAEERRQQRPGGGGAAAGAQQHAQVQPRLHRGGETRRGRGVGGRKGRRLLITDPAPPLSLSLCSTT